MNLYESGEMYLETIYMLSKSKGNVRSIDVAEYMNYSKPSVCRAVGLLKNGGYLLMAKDGSLTLTEEGIKVANKIFEMIKEHNTYKNGQVEEFYSGTR